MSSILPWILRLEVTSLRTNSKHARKIYYKDTMHTHTTLKMYLADVQDTCESFNINAPCQRFFKQRITTKLMFSHLERFILALVPFQLFWEGCSRTLPSVTPPESIANTHHAERPLVICYLSELRLHGGVELISGCIYQ